MPSAYVYPYYLKGIEQNAVATGSVPEEFLAQLPQTGCDPGELQAVVTVVVVVNLVYENNPDLDPFIVHFESTALGFDDPPDVSVGILNAGSTQGVPLTMDDWSIPGGRASPTTTTDARANNRPDPVPVQTPQPGGNNNAAGSGGDQTLNVPNPTQVTVGAVGTIPVIIGPSSQVVVGTITLRPGDPPILVGGVTPVQIVGDGVPTAIVVAGSTSQLPQVFDPSNPKTGAPAPPLITLGSLTLTPNAATQFSIGPSQILTPGGTVTFDGTVVSLAPSASFLVVGSSTQILAPAVPAASSPPQIVIGSSTITALPPPGSNPNLGSENIAVPGPSFVVDGQTLLPGGQAITVSGTTISLQAGGSSIVVNGATSAVINPAGVPQPSIRIGDSTFIAQPGNTFVIGDQTLSPGGQAITVSGTTLSLDPSASFVVIDGQTSQLPNSAAAQITAAPVLTIGNGIFRPLPGTGTSYLIGSSTLTPGGSVVVADTTISLAEGATALIVNGKTSLILPSAQGVITNAPYLTVGSQTYTAISGTTFIISGQTLTPGGVITVDGTTIRLSPSATELVYGSDGSSTTSALFPATTTRAHSVTSTASPSAGASGRNGQASPTQSRQGAASAMHPAPNWLISCLAAFSSVFVISSFVF